MKYKKYKVFKIFCGSDPEKKAYLDINHPYNRSSVFWIEEGRWWYPTGVAQEACGHLGSGWDPGVLEFKDSLGNAHAIIELCDTDATQYVLPLKPLEQIKAEFGIKPEEVLLLEQERVDILKIFGEKTNTFNTTDISQLINAINTKPFIILSGISGTGKTQIARIISAGMVRGIEEN